MSVDLRQLRYLKALAEERHFARAAQVCRVAQPTLSASIRQLEDVLGIPLVKRGNRFQGLTPEGERVLGWARSILAECDGLAEDASALRGRLGGRIALGVIPSALPTVPFLTAPFQAGNPDVRVTVRSRSSEEIQRDLDEYRIQLGISYLENEPLHHVRTRLLYHETYVLLVPAGTALAERSEIGWAEAAGLSLCLLTPDMQNRRIVDAAFEAAGTQPEPGVETNSLATLYAHVRHGPWASIVPANHQRLIGVGPELRAIPLFEPEIRQAVGLIAPDREPLPPLTARLWEAAAPLEC